jgi:hypothetical protein
MTRLAPVITCSGLAVASWLGMQIVHECGHAVGAWLTDGRVVRVVLHPLAISRTDVNPNPVPAVVVWLGPIAGCCLPILTACLLTQLHRCNAMHATAKLWQRANSMGWFFAGFCLIANGAYLVFGTLDRVGDCGEMLRTGTPAWPSTVLVHRRLWLDSAVGNNWDRFATGSTARNGLIRKQSQYPSPQCSWLRWKCC